MTANLDELKLSLILLVVKDCFLLQNINLIVQI